VPARPGGGRARAVDPRRRDVGGAGLQPAVRRVARAPAAARPALVRAPPRPALHGAVAARRLRLHRAAAAADAARGHVAVPDAEAVLEPLHEPRAPHLHLAGSGRLAGADALPA